MSTEIEVKYLSIKSHGRAHLACHRCRVQKIKCSGVRPTCRNCIVSRNECLYPGRDRIVTIQESEISKLQRQIKHLESKLSQSEQSIERSAGTTVEQTDPEILEDSYFQNSTRADNSLFSFLDVDWEDEFIIPSNTSDGLRYYYDDDDSSQTCISEINLSLPEKNVALSLVEKAISFIGHEYYLFDNESFLHQVKLNYDNNLKPDDPTNWMCYFLITLAIGEQFSNVAPTTKAPGIEYYNACIKLLKPSFEEGTLELVQTHLLIAFYQQGLNRSNSAFATYGTAIRLSLALGLHRKVKNLSLEVRERRRRLWWTCYVMDSIWAAKIGQPIHVNFNDISVEIDAITDLSDGFKVDILKHNAELAMVIGYVMKRIYKQNSKRTISAILDCLRELNNYQKNLPQSLKEAIITKGDRTCANLYLRLNQIVIITTRPLILSKFVGQETRSSNKPEFNQAVQKCVIAASANINILKNLKVIGLFSNFGFWDARYLFSSSLILYMISGGVDSYSSLIGTARELNKEMASSRNSTAIENERRFEELDALFNKIHYSSPQLNLNIPPKENNLFVTPNSLLLDDIEKIFTDISVSDTTSHNLDHLFLPLPKELMPDIWKDIATNLKSWDTS